MYNKNYYPTPQKVIDLMLEGIDFKNKIVLDPSAGMGAILNAVQYKCKKTYAIEIDDTFQDTLKGRNHTILHSDFLTYSGTHAFDVILMNPPFDNGAKHFLKAMQIAKPSTIIVCLLNYETINNPYSEDRQNLIKEVEFLGGTIQNIGNAFLEADRKTGVEVAMIKVTKPANQSAAFTFENLQQSQEFKEFDINNSSSELERYDKIGSFCNAYNNAIAQLPVMFDAIQKMRMFMSPFATNYKFNEMLKDLSESVTYQYQSKSYTETHNDFVKVFQSLAWNKIFSESRVTHLMTQKVREDFDKKREAMGGFDLNPENVMMAFAAIFNQRRDIEDACILESFDWLTRYSEKNRTHFGESWKTNSHYMVGSKIIIPCLNSYCSFSYHSGDKLDDLDRSLCLLSGTKFDTVLSNENLTPFKSVRDAIRECLNFKFAIDVAESHFFKIKIYKKGTAHITFKDENLRMLFNKTACESKGWQLPETETFNKKNRRK